MGRHTPTPLPDPAGFPDRLSLRDVARIYHVSPGTILAALHQGWFQPRPIRGTQPPRWHRRDILGHPTVGDWSRLPLLLTLEEMAILYDLSPSTIRHALSTKTFRPPPFDKYPYRWRRADVHAYLHGPGRRREPRRRSVARVEVRPAPITDLAGQPVLLTLQQMARIYRVSPLTIRRQLATHTCRPPPVDSRPYRWSRADVERDLATTRTTLRVRKHGFAAR